MIIYRIAFVGNDLQIYEKAQEYFSSKTEEIEDFKFELVDISNFDELDIKSTHFHGFIYDIDDTRNSKDEETIKNLLDSKMKIEDLKIFPLAKKEITKNEKDLESKRLSGIAKKEIEVVPINVSNEQDLKSVFQAIDIASIEYQELAEDIINKRQQEFEKTAETLLKNMEEKSPYTAGHFRQVGIYAEAIAKQMGKDEEEVKKIKSIAILHDAGKLLIPEELLNNPSMTVGNERNQMELHSDLGINILSKALFDYEERGGIVEHHNSQTDNKYAKIIAVADCIDAMTSQRLYNNPKTITEVFRDLAKNKYEQPKRDKKGNIVKDEAGNTLYNPPQFDEKVADYAIVLLANELGKCGFDIRKMLESTSTKWNETQNQEIAKILNEHSNEITINTSAKQGEYTSLGFRLDERGFLEFKDRPTSVVNNDIRVKSEYEFAIFKNSNDEQKEEAKTIKDLEKNYSQEELEKFEKLAEEKVNKEDENGKKAIENGFCGEKTIPSQIVEATKNDIDFNEKGYSKFIEEMSIVIQADKKIDKDNTRDL